MEFRIGTSGWMYDHWRNAFYPPNLKKKDWLAYYQRHFDTVELNNSFYRMPGEKAWRAWHDSAPDRFRFAVKASRFITHFKRFQDPKASLDTLFEGAGLLEEHLGPVLYQARPDFERTQANVERIDAFLSLLPRSFQHVMEFRHDSWFGDETLRQLGRHGVAFCSYDMPGIQCPLASSTGFAYMRFHGSGAKYAGSYTPELLGGWARRLRDLSRDVDSLWVYFNNDAQGFAVENALRLRELLGK